MLLEDLFLVLQKNDDSIRNVHPIIKNQLQTKKKINIKSPQNGRRLTRSTSVKKDRSNKNCSEACVPNYEILSYDQRIEQQLSDQELQKMFYLLTEKNHHQEVFQVLVVLPVMVMMAFG